MDFLIYRGYFIHFRGASFGWRFMAAPGTPDFPILSRATSRLFESRAQAVAEAKTQTDRLLIGRTAVANWPVTRHFYARENDNDAGTAGVLTMDEARRMASSFAKLPELLGRG